MNNPKTTRLRYWGFRLAAIVLGLAPFVIIETTLRLGGWSETDEVMDPYVGFSEIRPLFELDPGGTSYRISPTRYPLFQPDQFDHPKPVNEFRVFCLGGSTVQGRPFSIETSFTTWLELSLQAACPDRTWQVVNCGGVSYASYRLVPILKEVLKYQPDLVILYTGHNEFLEDRTYQQIKGSPAWIQTTHELLSYSTTYRFLRSRFTRPQRLSNQAAEARDVLPAEVEAELDFKGGLDYYRRDDDWRRQVVEHFEFNLQRMIAIAGRAGVPMILVNPVSNLRDTPPFKSQHRDDATSNERQQIDRLYSGPGGLGSGSEPPAFESVEQELAFVQGLVERNPRHAGLQFRLGHCLLALNRTQEAGRAFVRAKEEDVCPLRMLDSMHEILLKLAKEYSVPLVDAKRHFDQLAADGIPGDELLVDHVHPSIRSHQRLAEFILAELEQQGFVAISDDSWQETRERAYRSQLKSLDFMYFQRGEDRLRGLRRWAGGKVTRERPQKEGVN